MRFGGAYMRMPDGVLMILIIMLGVFAPISTDMFLPALDEMMVYFNTDEATLSMTMYMFMLFLAIGILFLGPVSDKYGRRNVLICSLALYILASIACSIVDTIELMVVSRILQSIGAGGGMAISIALIRDCFNGEGRAKVLTVVAVIGVLGPVLAPIIGQAIIWALDWKATFWAPGLVAAVCMLLAFLLPGDIPKERYKGSIVSSVGTVVPIMRNGDFRRFTVMMTMVAFCILAYVSVSEYIYKDKGFGVGDLYSLYLAGAMILGVLSMLIIERVAKNISNRGHLKIQIALITIAVVITWTIGGMHPLLFLMGVVPIITVSSLSRSFGFNILLSQDVGNSGAISSVLNFTNFIFATLGMVVVVNLPFGNYITSVAFCFTIYLVVYLVLWIRMNVKGTSLKGFE
jgi:DHA1 family bicyclomycin/chloramphenicol resistance-like MFS transporter